MEDNILGCFVSFTNTPEQRQLIDSGGVIDHGAIFRTYVWGDNGICDHLKELKNTNYGKDLKLVLLEFYVKPIEYLLSNLKEIESYRKKEKAIGIPIIVDDHNFFDKSEKERYIFLKEAILQKMDILKLVIKKKKLDTNIELLKFDVSVILNDLIQQQSAFF